MVRGEFTPQARLSQHIKDVRLMLEEAARGGTTLPISAVHLELLEQAEAAGLGELDNSAIIRVIADQNLRQQSLVEVACCFFDLKCADSRPSQRICSRPCQFQSVQAADIDHYIFHTHQGIEASWRTQFIGRSC